MDISEGDSSVEEARSGGHGATERQHYQLLEPPRLEVTGLSTEKLRRQNKRRRVMLQEQQQEYSQWTTHQGTMFVAEESWDREEVPMETKLYPRGRAMEHPAGPLLQEWVEYGCPTHTGTNWTREQMQAAIERGPHKSAREPEAIQHFQDEIEEKVKVGQAKVILWDDIKDNPPPQLKISPVAAIPHKSKAYRSILDLSFRLRLKEGGVLPAVNDTTVKTAPAGAIDQIGHSLKQSVYGEMGY